MMKQITNDTYLKTIGLLQLAKENYDRMKLVEDALCTLLKVEKDEQGYSGHISDAIFGEEYSADQLLHKIGITVNKDKLFKHDQL